MKKEIKKTSQKTSNKTKSKKALPKKSASKKSAVKTVNQDIQWGNIGLCYLLAVFLYLSFVLPPLNGVWVWIDEVSFVFLNGIVCIANETVNKIVSYANTRIYDKISALALLSVLALYVLFSKTRDFFTRAGVASFVALFMLIGVNLRRETGFLEYDRLSPSLDRDFCNLRDFFPEMSPKVMSASSFPGDHFISCIFFVVLLWALGGRRWGIASLMLTPLFFLPRLISGAHWMSDGLVGSVIFCLLVLSWVLFTPLGEKAVQAIGAFYKKVFGNVFKFAVKGLKLFQ